MIVWTVGHSSRSMDEFLALLEGARVEAVADVRRHPGSRAHPQFNPGPFAAALSAHGIRYAPCPELGGRRTPRADSRNTVWRNRSFRGYADYMETEEFEAALEELVRLAAEKRTALLCAEAPWWRCHRALIADSLKARGVEVRHIMEGGKLIEHPFTSVASLVDGKLVYGPAPRD